MIKYLINMFETTIFLNDSWPDTVPKYDFSNGTVSSLGVLTVGFRLSLHEKDSPELDTPPVTVWWSPSSWTRWKTRALPGSKEYPDVLLTFS